MGSNHMNEQFRSAGKNSGNNKPKYKIPEYDPQTGEANPHYEELTGNKLPQYDTDKAETVPETDMDKLNRLLITVAETDAGYRRKIMMLKKFVDIATEQMNKED